jgi:hypothetical protein
MMKSFRKLKMANSLGGALVLLIKNRTGKMGLTGFRGRFLEDIELLEVSILDKTPAYIATSIEARGEVDVITENRSDGFRAEIEDLTPKKEEKREEIVDYSLFEIEIEILKLRGSR